MSVARVLIATLLLLGLMWLWRRVKIWLLKALGTTALLPEKYLRFFAVDLRMHILQGGRAAIRFVSAVVVLVLGYWWLVYSLEQFPYTASLGEKLETFLVRLFLDFGRGALAAIPGLVAVAIIILIAIWFVRVINTIFKEVEKGKLSLPWLEKETARTTQTLLIVAVWLFALVVAYPYIPGSDTYAFKGLERPHRTHDHPGFNRADQPDYQRLIRHLFEKREVRRLRAHRRHRGRSHQRWVACNQVENS